MIQDKREELKEAILQKNLFKVGLLELQVPQSDIDKEILMLAIQSKNGLILNAISLKANKDVFDKDILKEALETKMEPIIKTVVNKTDKKYFDKEILKNTILNKDEKVFNLIVTKTEAKYFDKEILMNAIDSKNGEIVKVVCNFAKPEYFSKETLDKAISVKEADVTRAIVDRISDRVILDEYREKIQKSVLGVADIKNLTAQILSREDNKSFDRELQETILDIYLDVIQQQFSKGNMPKNFPIKAFENSIAQSRYFFECPDKINFNSLNEKNKFLLIPVFAYGHAYSAVVRKLENNNISVTFVNLGARPFESGGAGNQYKEYVYTPENALKVLKDHSYNVRLYYPEKAVSTQQAYKNYKASAIEEYYVNVGSRDQKVGNCFLKNIEKGLRYALALGMSEAINPEFDPNSLRVTKTVGDKSKVKFLKPIFKPGEKTNELTTLQLREELVKSLIKKYPEYKNEIMVEWNIYKVRKEKTAGKTPIIPETRKEKTNEDSSGFNTQKLEFNKKLQEFAKGNLNKQNQMALTR